MSATTLRGRASAGQAAAESTRRRLAILLDSWRYSGTGRDLRLDLLRGFAVFAMIADHIGGDPSWLYRLTGGDRFFTTAAEGFVFISGLVFGIVYAGVLARQGLAEGMMKALRRAGVLYLLTVVLTLATAAAAVRFQLYWAPQDVTRATLRDFVLSVVTLHRTFYMTDVLLLYTLLLVCAAASLVFFATGRTWMVLATSWGLWALWQLDYRYASFVWGIQGNDIFHLVPWQLLFFTGLAIGYHRVALARRFGWAVGPWSLAISGGLFAWLIVLFRTNLAGFPGANNPRVVEWFTYKPNVGPGRVFAFAVVAIFAISLTTTLWRPLARATSWLLLPLGQHALFAYSIHLFILGLTWRLSVALLGYGPSTGEHVFLQLAGIAAVLWAIKLKLRLMFLCAAAELARAGTALPRAAALVSFDNLDAMHLRRGRGTCPRRLFFGPRVGPL
ncbi:MAG: OpgC domain-containing protein [Chloroflexia bacterium]